MKSRRRLVWIFLPAFWLLGCGSSGAPVVHWKGPTLAIDAVLVGRVDVRLARSQSWHHYEKLRDALAAVEARDRLDAIAPWEIDIADGVAEASDYIKRTTLSPRAAAFGTTAERVAVLEVTLSERVAKQTTKVDMRGAEASARGYDSTLVVHARLLHPSSGRVIATINRDADENRFVETPDYDARPAARSLLTSAVSDLLAAAAEDAVVESAPRLGDGFPDVWESPARVLSWRHGTQPTLTETLATLDDVDRDARLYARLRYFDPDVPLERLPDVLAHGPALRVDGRWIRRAGDGPVETTFQLRRLWRRAPGLPLFP